MQRSKHMITINICKHASMYNMKWTICRFLIYILLLQNLQVRLFFYLYTGNQDGTKYRGSDNADEKYIPRFDNVLQIHMK